jgi:hypothetical protein
MLSKYRVDSSFNKSEGSYIYKYRVECLRISKVCTGYGEDTGWKVGNRLSTLNFGPHKRSLNTRTATHAEFFKFSPTLAFSPPEEDDKTNLIHTVEQFGSPL